MKVGFSTVDITPRVGLPLMGNFRDDYAARGVHDPLQAKAVVFADHRGQKAAILAMDLCLLDRRNVAYVRKCIAGECDVPPEHVLVHATHTHSGPMVNDREDYGIDLVPCAKDIEQLLQKAAGAVAQANRQLTDVTLSIGTSQEERICFNRRLRRKDGATQMNWESLEASFDSSQIEAPWGPVDPQVLCLCVEQQGKPVGAVVNFGLHPAILAGDNWLYSADYPGYLAEAMARVLGPGFNCLFLNGCCGDVNHVDYREPFQGRGYSMAQRVGYMLAVAALEAMAHRRLVEAEEVVVGRSLVSLPPVQISPEEYRRCQEVLEEARRSPLQGQVDGLPEAFFAHLRHKMHQNQHAPDEVEVMTIRLGEVAIVGLPGENVCESGLQVKHDSPASHTLVAGNANDAIGYLPRREAFAQGGYECIIGSTFYEPGAAERLVESALSQVKRLFATDRMDINS